MSKSKQKNVIFVLRKKNLVCLAEPNRILAPFKEKKNEVSNLKPELNLSLVNPTIDRCYVMLQKPTRRGSVTVNALPSLDMVSLMAVMVEHVEFSRDYVVTKSIWHLSDTALKSVCEFFYQHHTHIM
jgi:hypothetical protein